MEELKLTFVNVGYGEAMVLECPDPAFPGGTFVMVIDGGSGEEGEYADRTSGRVPMADYLAERGLDHIDLCVVTHPHEDHICGLLPVAEKWPPAVLWQSLSADFCHRTLHPVNERLAQNLSQDKFLHALNQWQTLLARVKALGGQVQAVAAGYTAQLARDLRVRVLSPSPRQTAELEERCARLFALEDEGAFLQELNALDARLNNFSIMLALEYRGTRILLPGDTNRAGYGDVDTAALPAHLFKVGHHGQKDGISPELLDIIRPDMVVCCASSDRRYNSAHPDLMDRIEASGAALYFSDCPQLPGRTPPPHRALIFTVGEQGAIRAQYE